MATYETGTATDTTDLIDKLIAFATTNGWTVNTPASGRVFTKGGLFFGLQWGVSTVNVAGATGYNAGAAWNAQPGASGTQPLSNDMAGPFNSYHFFTDTAPDYLHVVVEKTPGVYKHFMFGQLVKHGTFTGGEYIGAVYWHPTNVSSVVTPNYPNNTYHALPFDGAASNAPAANRSSVRADIDSKTDNWMLFQSANSYNGNHAKGAIRASTILEALQERTPNQFNQITPLLPMMIAAERPSTVTSPLGYVPDMRLVNVSNIDPGAVVTIAGIEWLVFPLIQKTQTFNVSGSTVPSSGTYGFAYRRN
jgi:hypothetical protein